MQTWSKMLHSARYNNRSPSDNLHDVVLDQLPKHARMHAVSWSTASFLVRREDIFHYVYEQRTPLESTKCG